jgi:hypothetical protein
LQNEPKSFNYINNLLNNTIIFNNIYYYYDSIDNKLIKKLFNIYSLNEFYIFFVLPINNITICFSLYDALKINIIKQYYSNNFIETPIKFKYYNLDSNNIFDGPDIIISNQSLDCIFYENNLFTNLIK